MKWFLAAVLVGCSAAEDESSATTSPPENTATTIDTETTQTTTTTTTSTFAVTGTFMCSQTVPGSELHGSYPPTELPVATFDATSHEGLARTSADLVGHPTVVWFYPKAGTAG